MVQSQIPSLKSRPKTSVTFFVAIFDMPNMGVGLAYSKTSFPGVKPLSTSTALAGSLDMGVS